MSKSKVLLDDQELAQQPRPAPRRRTPRRRNVTQALLDSTVRMYNEQMLQQYRQEFFNEFVTTDESSVEREVQTPDADSSNPGPVSPPTEPERASLVTRASVDVHSSEPPLARETEASVADRAPITFNIERLGVYISLMPGDSYPLGSATLMRMPQTDMLAMHQWVRTNGLITEYNEMTGGWRIRRPD